MTRPSTGAPILAVLAVVLVIAGHQIGSPISAGIPIDAATIHEPR